MTEAKNSDLFCPPQNKSECACARARSPPSLSPHLLTRLTLLNPCTPPPDNRARALPPRHAGARDGEGALPLPLALARAHALPAPSRPLALHPSPARARVRAARAGGGLIERREKGAREVV